MKINSKITFGKDLIPADQTMIKREPMLHRADRKFAEENGGFLTKYFLTLLNWKDDILVDSRVHMLMKEYYPAIPGFHGDDVPREREDGQPNYDNPSYKAEHCMALWGDCSLTEFALGEHEIDIPPIGEKIYKILSPQIERLCQERVLERVTIPECKMVYFDWQSWHRATPATKRGFRFFIRATRYSKLETRNEIRFNANVYMENLDEGW